MSGDIPAANTPTVSAAVLDFSLRHLEPAIEKAAEQHLRMCAADSALRAGHTAAEIAAEFQDAETARVLAAYIPQFVTAIRATLREHPYYAFELCLEACSPFFQVLHEADPGPESATHEQRNEALRATAQRLLQYLDLQVDLQLTVDVAADRLSRDLLAPPLVDRFRELLGEQAMAPDTPSPEPHHPRLRLPPIVPQQTFPEARTLGMALADGPTGRHWTEVPGEIALKHSRPRWPLQVKYAPGATVGDWGARPLDSYGALRDELQEAGLPAALLMHVVLHLALTHDRVNVGLDDLILAIGWRPRSQAERQALRYRMWRMLRQLAEHRVIGQRKGVYPDLDHPGEVINTRSNDPLIAFTGQDDPEQPAFDGSAPPLRVSIVAGDTIYAWRGDRRLLTYFGNVLPLAAIPAGKPTGAWAQSIGLAIVQYWRDDAAHVTISHVGDQNRPVIQFPERFTRRQLLTLYHPEPDVEAVLKSENPHRARQYFTGALKLLKEHEVILNFTEPAPPKSRARWQREWLDQEVTLRPPTSLISNVMEIKRRAEIATKTAARKRQAKRARANR